MRTAIQQSLRSKIPRSRPIQLSLGLAIAVLILAFFALRGAQAIVPSNQYFLQTWQRTDKPVKDGDVSRTWIWGADQANTGPLMEAYADSPGGMREVQYYDKSRMEITHPDAAVVFPWYVTNGLLVNELMTGQMQVGDALFENRFPAEIPVAGDLNDTNGPTYRTFGMLMDSAPVPEGTVYQSRLSRSGTLTGDPSLAVHNVTATYLDTVTNHRIAAPFWDFMNSSGPVYEEGAINVDDLFINPFYGTGRPKTEAYWMTSVVAGTPRDVLAQCFERRCLTYTPGNPPGFVVEAGNVGLHYYQWRYETAVPTPTPTATSTATATMEPTPTFTPTATATATVTGDTSVEVTAFVDCDNDGDEDGTASDVGSAGVCGSYTGGELTTTTNGLSLGVDEVQELGPNNAMSGFITLIFQHPTAGTITITGIDHDATASEIQTAIDAEFMDKLVAADSPTVEGGPLDMAPVTFTFENGDLAESDVAQMTVNNSLLVLPTVSGTAGTVTTTTQGAAATDEIQELSPNDATGGTFTLTFLHPSEGAITTGPIAYNASEGNVQLALNDAFADASVLGDTPTVDGGPADENELVFTFENGALAGTNVNQMTVDNDSLTTTIQVSKVEVYDDEGTLVATWQVDSTGIASGDLTSGMQYDFRFTYTENTGESDTQASGLMLVEGDSVGFSIMAHLEYEA